MLPDIQFRERGENRADSADSADGGAPVANRGRPHANVHADVPLICQPAGIGNPARGRWHDALLREIEAMFRSAGLTITSSLPARIIPTGAARTDAAIAFCRTAVPSGNTSERSSTPPDPSSVRAEAIFPGLLYDQHERDKLKHHAQTIRGSRPDDVFAPFVVGQRR